MDKLEGYMTPQELEQDKREHLEAENARLQSKVEEIRVDKDFWYRKYQQALDMGEDEVRDRYKARDKLRGEALKPFASYHQARLQAAPRAAAKDSTVPVLSYGKVYLGDKHFREAHAAIAMTPEEAKEKEKR